MGIKTKLNARLAIWQRADLFEASNSANKISLPLRCIFFLAFLRPSKLQPVSGITYTLTKQPTFLDATTGFPAEKGLKNDLRKRDTI